MQADYASKPFDYDSYGSYNGSYDIYLRESQRSFDLAEDYSKYDVKRSVWFRKRAIQCPYYKILDRYVNNLEYL